MNSPASHINVNIYECSNIYLFQSLIHIIIFLICVYFFYIFFFSKYFSKYSSKLRYFIEKDFFMRYPVPDKKNLPFDIVELMEKVEQKGGFLPNVFKVLVHCPAEFRTFFSNYNVYFTFVTGGLSKADRELIVVATSAHNHCLYCVVSHSALHRIYSKKPVLADQVPSKNFTKHNLSAREKAMLDFALAVCWSETVTEEHLSTLEAHGFDREDIWDIAAFFALSNRMARLTDLRPNAEFYNMGRVPRDTEKSL
uniref:Si:ch211-175m2.5 n=1 Tax=Sinocyclocheilus grahami TaxID=75366 RepID=A0A672K5D9_SINGR